MTQVILGKFDGGHAEDLRTHNTDECEYSKNFDVFLNPHKLVPFADSIAETTATDTMDDIEISDIDYASISGTYYLMGIGYETSSSTKPTFWNKSAISNGGTLNWTSYAVAAGNAFVKGSGFVYKDLYYCLGFNGSNQYTLYRFDSAGSVTAKGSISSSSTSYVRPFVHPEDTLVYIVIGTTITVFNGTDSIGSGSSVTSSTILPSGMFPTSLTDYGSYLAIAMSPTRGNGNSTVYLWGRDITLNTLQGSVDFGEGRLVALENLNNNLFALMQPHYALTTSYTRLVIKQYAGGAVDTIKSLAVLSSQNVIYSAVGGGVKNKNNNKMYFVMSNDDSIWVIGKNKSGNYIVSQDKYLFNGASTATNPQALQMIGDVLWRGFYTNTGVYTLMRSRIASLGESLAYASTCKYRTTINPGMRLEDRYKNKQLKSVRISYTGKSSGTIALKTSVDGSSMTAAIDETGLTAIEDVKESDCVAGTSEPLLSGREFQFQFECTGGVEIKQVEYFYEVLPSLN